MVSEVSFTAVPAGLVPLAMAELLTLPAFMSAWVNM